MIRPLPHTDAGRLLTLLSAGASTLDDLADALEPRPRLTGTAGYPAWRAAVAAWEASTGARRARVSRLLGRLREAGYVAPGRPAPRVAADVPDPMPAAWWRRRLRAVAEVDPDAEDYDPAGGETAPCGTALEIVARIRAGALTVTAAVGSSGCAWETWAALVGAEVVEAGRVELTERGRGVVEGWGP